MPLSIGIVGAGGIAQTHADILADHDDADLTAICDIDPEKAETLAERTDAEAYTDYRDLFDDVALDGVYVTTPPQTRVDIIREAAKNDVGIFCEKPLATRVSTGQTIRDIVAESDVPFMMGFCSRFAEPCRQMQEMLADGEIGAPITVFSDRAGYGVPQEDNWRVDPDHACGITIESASHNIDLLRWLGGEIASASGRTANVSHPELELFDDNMIATLQFEDGPMGWMQNSWTSHVEYLRHGIVGTEGAIVLEGEEWWRLDRLTYARESDPYPQTITFDSETATEMGYPAETDAFLQSLAEDTIPPVDVYDGLRALEVSHEIFDG